MTVLISALLLPKVFGEPCGLHQMALCTRWEGWASLGWDPGSGGPAWSHKNLPMDWACAIHLGVKPNCWIPLQQRTGEAGLGNHSALQSFNYTQFFLFLGPLPHRKPLTHESVLNNTTLTSSIQGTLRVLSPHQPEMMPLASCCSCTSSFLLRLSLPHFSAVVLLLPVLKLWVFSQILCLG